MSALQVLLGDIEVGVLENFEDESERFTFAEGYLSAFIERRPILGQIFEDRFPDPITVGGPIAWFSHLLPQGAMRHWRSRLYGIDEDDSFSMLSYLGKNLPGAVILRPTNSSLGRNRVVAKTLIKQQGNDRFRFSLAGAQWKMSARSSGRGLTTSAEALGREYIAKFHSPDYPDLPQCEFATMHWAKCVGLNTPEFELRSVGDIDDIPEGMPTGNGQVFVAARFDRANTRRTHMEDFAQILDRPTGNEQYRGSYEEIARVLRWISPSSIDEFIRLVVFNLICGNGDAHLKNFSVLYDNGRDAALSPAYDLVSTIVYSPPSCPELALQLGGSDKFDSSASHRFYALLESAECDYEKGYQFIIDFARKVVDAWQLTSVKENYSSRHRERLELHVTSVAKSLSL